MKKLAWFLFLFPLTGRAQTFQLTDSVFTVNSIYHTDIFFELNKAVLNTTSYQALDSFANFMTAHPELVIEVANHRDTRSDDQYSMNLTQRRAEAVVDYLVEKGIAPERLVPKGYADLKPLISDDEISKLTSKEEIEKAHQTNRRTEFVILKNNYGQHIPLLPHEAQPIVEKLQGYWRLGHIQSISNGELIIRTDSSQIGGDQLYPPLPTWYLLLDSTNFMLNPVVLASLDMSYDLRGSYNLTKKTTQPGSLPYFALFSETDETKPYIYPAKIEFMNEKTFRLIFDDGDEWWFTKVR